MQVFFAESLDTFTPTCSAPAHGVLLGAAAVGEVPAGRVAKMPPAKLDGC
jgi:hypothetical protein